MSDRTLELTKQLIARPSVTPDDADCQALMAEWLEPLGFHCEHLRFGDVDNLWARRGDTKPLFVFAGHTDVVPPGPETEWHSDPFIPEIRDGKLYGRGAADMKTSLAAFVTAIESFIEKHPDHKGSIGLLITSDEEGDAVDGTVKVVQTLTERGEQIDYCLVGEPSSENQLGDVVKNGRRGSIGATLTIKGKQGHIAYPHLADNPNHRLGDVINGLLSIEWDQGNDHFPPTSLQISNVFGGTGAPNVIPGEVVIHFNLRYSTETTADAIQQRIGKLLEEMEVEHSIEWKTSGNPFLTPGGELLEACKTAIASELGIETSPSTAGGTSDGRFIAPTGAQVVELGPVNESIHKINEHVDVETPQKLSEVYEKVMEEILL